ncbi:MAG: PAS domain S-box protein [Desulfococcaceae bacterium]|jgi:PAS domain S-box-containing protein|nr:PAS domain S-box protein [Desulfococcaceae bacterium]
MTIPFAHILDELDALVYVADMDSHEILYANARAKKLFGNGIVGKICWQKMQEDQTGPCPFCTNHLLTDEKGNAKGVHVWEFENTRTGKWYMIRDRAIPWTDGRMVRLEIATDISERKRSENLATAFRDLSHAFWITKNPEEYYAQVHEIFRCYIAAENFYVALADREKDRVIFPYFSDETMALPPILYGLSSRGQNTLTVEVIRSRKPLFITREEILARIRSGQMKPKGTIPEIWLGVPLILNQEIIGAIAVQNYRNPMAFSEKDSWFMISVSELIALAIERGRNEQFLRESEEKHRALSQATFEAVLISEDGICIECNQTASDMFGYPREELVGIFSTDIIAPESVETVQHNILSGYEGACEALAVRKDGTFFPAEFRSRMFHYRGRDVRTTAVRDLSRRKEAENRLRQSMAVLESIFRAAPVGIGMIRDRKLLSVNEKMSRMTGYGKKELIGNDIRMIYTDQEEYERVGRIKYGQIAEKGTGTVETHWLCKNGRVIDILLSTAPVAAKDFSKGFTFTAMDISEHNQLETQLRESQKMEAVGRLAGGIAHDFNNLLQVINGYADLALSDLNLPHPVKHSLEEILSAGEKARSLVYQLLTFSRRQMTDMKKVPVNELVQSHIRLIRRTVGDHIDTDFIPAAGDAGIIRADPGQIGQALMNLCTNARDAMPDGGRLMIRTEKVRVNLPRGIKIHLAKPGYYACISIKDTGCGMDENTLKQIFEPFFTSRESGKGSGLGLAMVFGIIRQHKGMTDVRSEIGKGSEFRIYLPLSEKSDLQKEERKSSTYTDGKKTILIAEDEEMIRELVQTILEKEGYRVICAKDGQEAIDIWAANPKEIDLLFLDMSMPRRSGQEVCAHIRKQKPDARILFTGAYHADASDDAFVRENGPEMIRKPYKRQALLYKIRQILE